MSPKKTEDEHTAERKESIAFSADAKKPVGLQRGKFVDPRPSDKPRPEDPEAAALRKELQDAKKGLKPPKP